MHNNQKSEANKLRRPIGIGSGRLLGCIIHPDEKITATHEDESPFSPPYWICGCDHDDCWEYGGTKEQAIYKWNKKQACGDCDSCLGGRPDQCAMQPNEKLRHGGETTQ